jgi:AraC-like DNA-binding protein
MRQAIGVDQRSAGLMAEDPPGSGCRTLAREDTAFLERLCHDVAADPGTARGETGLAYLFLAAWERFSQAQDLDQTAVHPALQLATAALSRNLAIDADAAAAAAGISRFHLARLFRSQMDTTLLAWRTRVRVEHAIAKRQERPQREWIDIAADCGFGSYAQFIRSFRSVTGKTPRNWR